MLDPPLKIGHSEIADNDALASIARRAGASRCRKDLILDLNPIGQLAGLGPQVALVTHLRVAADRERDERNRDRLSAGSLDGHQERREIDCRENVQFLGFEPGDDEAEFAPTSIRNDPKNTKGPLTIAAAGSYNTGKENSQGRFVVIGSSAWAANSFLNFNGNRDLALNTMNWLSSDEDLISIRPKAPEDRRVTMTRAQMSVVRITSQFILPLIVIFAGVSVWWRRR